MQLETVFAVAKVVRPGACWLLRLLRRLASPARERSGRSAMRRLLAHRGLSGQPQGADPLTPLRRPALTDAGAIWGPYGFLRGSLRWVCCTDSRRRPSSATCRRTSATGVVDLLVRSGSSMGSRALALRPGPGTSRPIHAARRLRHRRIRSGIGYTCHVRPGRGGGGGEGARVSGGGASRRISSASS